MNASPSAPPSTDARLSGLSAFMPLHDEEENVVAAAEELLEVLPRVARSWELILVDDGSRDRTGERADALARQSPGVRIVRHAVNRGYGAAVRSGLAAARYDYIFFTDGDRQFDVGELDRLIAALGDGAAAVGRRVRRADPVLRRLNGVAWNFLLRTLFGLPVRDANCAFKLIRREALAGIELEAEGATVSAELIASLAAHGHRIVEMPVSHFPRRHGQPSGANPRVIARAFVELVRMSLRFRSATRQPGTVAVR